MGALLRLHVWTWLMFAVITLLPGCNARDGGSRDLAGSAWEDSVKVPILEPFQGITEEFKSIVSYYRALRGILGHGEQVVENGIQIVRVPPLSAMRPEAKMPKTRWWQFW